MHSSCVPQHNAGAPPVPPLPLWTRSPPTVASSRRDFTAPPAAADHAPADRPHRHRDLDTTCQPATTSSAPLFPEVPSEWPVLAPTTCAASSGCWRESAVGVGGSLDRPPVLPGGCPTGGAARRGGDQQFARECVHKNRASESSSVAAAAPALARCTRRSRTDGDRVDAVHHALVVRHRPVRVLDRELRCLHNPSADFRSCAAAVVATRAAGPNRPWPQRCSCPVVVC